MSQRLPPRTRVARLLMVLAALLYFGGASAGPWAHVREGAAATPRAEGSVPGEPGKKAPHGDLACAVCQALGAAAVAGAEPSYGHEPTLRAPLPEHPAAGAPVLPAASPRARAPPLA